METRINAFFANFRNLAKNKRTHRALILAILTYVLPYFMSFYFVCGLLDVMRNKNKEADLFYKYFIGSGSITWLLAPFNLFLDLITLPYWNKGVYKLEDLPAPYQEELQSFISKIDNEDIVQKLDDRLEGKDREMIFFKWYRHNIDTPIKIPAFHKNYKYISTIGVSVFNKKRSTSRHYGPFRPTLRVLYNINSVESDKAYIEVGNVRNYWYQNRLFIFDDTLFHQSVNESDELRYCAFIDIVRPSLWPGLMRFIVAGLGFIFIRTNHIFYNAWSFIK